jgi:steroid delta-isomerase-like uncharacterized protein
MLKIKRPWEEKEVSTTDNRAIAHRFIQAWRAGGSTRVDELASTDLTVFYTHFPEPVQGSKAFKQLLAETHHFFPDLEITADDIIVEGDQAVVCWTYRASHHHGELFGVSASGRKICVSGITRYRIVRGRVIEERGVVDNFSLMRQLGAAPVPGRDPV